eukprot:gene17237-22763_t
MAYKVQHPWNYELTDAEIEQQEIQKQLALDYEQKTPWDHENNQTTDEVTADFDKKLTGKAFTVVQPWDITESTILDNQNKAKLAQSYKYIPFWRPERITPKQRAILKSYQVHANCPYRREDNYEPDKKMSSIRCDPNRSAKTLPPWEIGKLPADPVNMKVEARPPTSLWNKPPEVKKVYPFVSSGDPILDNLREKLFEHGATGMLSLSRKFRIMDDNNNGSLDYDEFRKGMRECNIADLSEKAIKHLFHYFDKDDSGSISLDEFMFGIRGALNSRRKGLVDLAFKVLDKDGSGVIDYNDVKDVYNTASHPDYISGKKTKEEILSEFLSNFDQASTKTSTTKSTASDGIVTYDEFLQYYSNISASIDNDDYFELMIRNAWHISGGEGWSANTSNRRVLVTHEDGRQTVEEIKNDLGLDGKNKDEILNRLKLQGFSNGLIISDLQKKCDPSTDKSAACCDVNVGSMLDPVLAPGLAHFLEHMLFMGTKKYPDENAYQAYLSSHGGSSNAYTDQENTVYYFDVLPDYFEGALDIFASFFTCPSFNDSSTNREMKAVDSENSKNLQSDMWRSYQLFKSLAKPDHPFSYFSTGNLQTLQELPENSGVNVRDLLLEYYNNYYSSNIMKLCVYGKEDLDTLQNWVLEKFSLIPDRNVTVPSFPSDPYGPEQLSKLVHTIPIRDTKSLEISFLLPSTSHLYRSKPSKYLSHLIGHESEGSILAALKSKGLANSLSASTSNNCKDFSLLDITIELSDEGTSLIDDVISCVFAYVGILKREGAKEWIAKEIKDINDLNYKFLEKSQPSDYVTRLANSMQLYEPIDTIQSTYTVLDIDISNIGELIDRLEPSNCIILYKNKQVTTSKKEHWYGTDYEDYRFTNEQTDLWNNSLQGNNSKWLNLLGLPKPNPFIPNDFTIRSDSDSKSDSKNTIGLLNRESFGLILDKTIHKTNDVTSNTVDSNANSSLEENVDDEDEEDEVDNIENKETVSGKTMHLYSSKSIQSWFKMDDIWKVPLLNVVLSVETSQSSSSPFGVAMSDILQQVLKELLSEYSYYADCAGLHYTIQLSKSGLEFLFYGYHDKLPVLVYKTLEELKTLCSYTSQTIPTNISDIFNRMKEKTLRTYYNNLFWQPYYHCIMGTSICCEDPRWTSAEKYQALTLASLDDFVSFNRIFINTLKFEVSIHGNASVDEAKKISNEIVRIVNHKPLSSSQESIRRAVKFEPNTTYIYRQHAKHYNPDEVNSGIENVYYVTTLQGYENEILDKKRIELEAQIELISDKAFDQLRTKEQLGYVVFTGVKKVFHI